MAATQQYDYTAEEPRGAGWVAFAGIMLGLSGTFSIVDGIVALSKSSFYVANARYVFSDLHTWGWIILGLGILELVAAFAIFAGSELARWFGIFAASLNALGHLGFTHAYPFWALCMFAIDMLVVYALGAYGGHKLRTPSSA
jgi:hypothetical protein